MLPLPKDHQKSQNSVDGACPRPLKRQNGILLTVLCTLNLPTSLFNNQDNSLATPLNDSVGPSDHWFAQLYKSGLLGASSLGILKF